MIGSGKKFVEKSIVKRIGYTIFGEIHVPGRIRIKHALNAIQGLGLSASAPIRVLDVGCGKGDIGFVIAQKYQAWHVTGVELDEERHRDSVIIKERLGQDNVTLIKEDLLKLEGEGEYDIIICNSVLEQIEDDDSAVAKFNSLLKEGGHLILTTPSIPQRNIFPRLVKWREKRNGIDMSYFGHIRKGYSLSDICDKLSRFRFRNVEHKYTYGFFGTLAFDIFFVIGDSSPNSVLFALTFPFLLFLAFLDTKITNRNGSGLLIKACKAAETRG